jgi:heme A synthase
MRKLFAILATVMVVTLVAQFCLAASGAFDTAPIDESFHPHRVLGGAIIGFACLLTLVAALAKAPRRLIAMSGLVAALGLLQSLIGAVADALNGPGDASTAAGKSVFSLHALNALIIMAVAVRVARNARTLSRPAVIEGPPGAGDGLTALGRTA